MTMLDIDIEKVGVTISKKKIVDCADICVREGEFVGLIGPNGSGKSTLLKTVYRTLKPDTGEILLGGISTEDLSLKENAKRLAVVAQHNTFNFDFLVEDVVIMGRTPHKAVMEMDNSEDAKIVEDALELVNMTHMKGRKFSSLSGGEQQRIILARALAQQTPCLILDEPTNHLDIKYQLDVLDIVKSIGCTALCALHNLNLAAQFCDRVYILKDGKIRYEGTPEEVLTEDIIADIYGVKCTVSRNPESGLLNIVYHPKFAVGNMGERSIELAKKFAASAASFDASISNTKHKGMARIRKGRSQNHIAAA